MIAEAMQKKKLNTKSIHAQLNKVTVSLWWGPRGSAISGNLYPLSRSVFISAEWEKRLKQLYNLPQARLKQDSPYIQARLRMNGFVDFGLLSSLNMLANLI